MIQGNAKQVVILKNIQSNYIEEAILVLKNNQQGMGNRKKATGMISNLKNSDHIVLEAQSIIDKYVQQHYSKYNYYMPNQKKNNPVKKWNFSVGVILNIALFVSVALFILLLSRAI